MGVLLVPALASHSNSVCRRHAYSSVSLGSCCRVTSRRRARTTHSSLGPLSRPRHAPPPPPHHRSLPLPPFPSLQTQPARHPPMPEVTAAPPPRDERIARAACGGGVSARRATSPSIATALLPSPWLCLLASPWLCLLALALALHRTNGGDGERRAARAVARPAARRGARGGRGARASFRPRLPSVRQRRSPSWQRCSRRHRRRHRRRRWRHCWCRCRRRQCRCRCRCHCRYRCGHHHRPRRRHRCQSPSNRRRRHAAAATLARESAAPLPAPPRPLPTTAVPR